MNCSQESLKAYFLGELAAAERHAMEQHLPACVSCREELERLRVTRAALASVRDEEMPHRIAFVSDKVFEPRGWARLWNSAPRLGFASAAMLSAAILIHAFVQPAPVVPRAALDATAMEARIEAEVARRIQPVVEKAVADASGAQVRKTAELLAEAERRSELQRRADMVAVSEVFQRLDEKLKVYRASVSLGGGQ